MSGTAHSVRNSLFDNERTLHLDEQGIVWTDAKGDGRIAFADVNDVALVSYPAFKTRISQCTIRSGSGAKLKISSHSYISLNNFEDRSTSYEPFVRELCSKTTSANPQAQFHAGHNGIWYLSVFILVLNVAIIAMILIAGIVMSKLTGALPALFALVILLPFLWMQVRRGGSRAFDPRNLPPDL